MPAICPSIVRGRVMRITRLDECGVPVIGASTTVVSKGFVNVESSPQYVDGETIQLKNANDELCINEPGCPDLSGIELSINFCRVDPDAMNILTGDPLVLDDTAPTPNSVGFRIRGGDTCTTKFGLEVWSNVAGQECTTATRQYWYHLWPFVGSAQWGDWTIENDAVTFTITAMTYPGTPWDVGPYDVINAGVGPAPSPLLVAMDPLDHYHGQLTTLAPPTPVCGATALAA